MDLPTFEGADYSESYMSFTVNDKTQQDVFDPDDTDLGGNGYYGFTCNLNALQMADEITADFHYRVNGEEQTVSQIYTAEAYLNALVNNGEISDEVKALARSLLDYGYYSQAFLSGIENIGISGRHPALWFSILRLPSISIWIRRRITAVRSVPLWTGRQSPCHPKQTGGIGLTSRRFPRISWVTYTASLSQPQGQIP